MSLDWKGALGALWAQEAARTDALLGPLGEALLDAHPPAPQGALWVDIGCGAGAFTHELAQAAPDARIVGLDISADLLAAAQARYGDAADWVCADAAQYEFKAPVDGFYSRCGCMFFAAPVAAFENLRQTVKKGGVFRAAVWGPPELNDWAALPLRAVAPLIGEEAAALPPDGAPGPFAWSQPEIFTPILEAAGWGDVRYTPVKALCPMSPPGDAPIEDAVASAFAAGPMASRLRDRPKAVRAQARAALAAAFAPHVQDGAVRLKGAGWLIEARAAAA